MRVQAPIADLVFDLKVVCASNHGITQLHPLKVYGSDRDGNLTGVFSSLLTVHAVPDLVADLRQLINKLEAAYEQEKPRDTNAY